MERTATLGELRDVLAGLRDDVLPVLAGPDDPPCTVTTSLGLDGGQPYYVVAVELGPLFRPSKGGRKAPK